MDGWMDDTERGGDGGRNGGRLEDRGDQHEGSGGEAGIHGAY